MQWRNVLKKFIERQNENKERNKISDKLKIQFSTSKWNIIRQLFLVILSQSAAEMPLNFVVFFILVFFYRNGVPKHFDIRGKKWLILAIDLNTLGKGRERARHWWEPCFHYSHYSLWFNFHPKKVSSKTKLCLKITYKKNFLQRGLQFFICLHLSH